MIHTHGRNKGGRGVQSPADRLGPESIREPEPGYPAKPAGYHGTITRFGLHQNT